MQRHGMQCCGNHVRCQRPHEWAETHRTEVSDALFWLRYVVVRQNNWFIMRMRVILNVIVCVQVPPAVSGAHPLWAAGYCPVWHQTGLHTVWRYDSKVKTVMNLFLTWSWWSFGLLNKNCMCFLSGKRPFGVSLLYMGWDKHYGFQLYQSDPSGNYGGWKATCIGNNSAVSETHTFSFLCFVLFEAVTCLNCPISARKSD